MWKVFYDIQKFIEKKMKSSWGEKVSDLPARWIVLLLRFCSQRTIPQPPYSLTIHVSEWVFIVTSLPTTPAEFHCLGTGYSNQKNRWVTFLPAELLQSLNSIPKEPSHSPQPHLTAYPTAGTLSLASVDFYCPGAGHTNQKNR